MTPADLRAALARLGLTQAGAAHLLGVDARTMRRWLAGTREMPEPARRLLVMLDLPEVRQRLSAAA
jgi:DNA-binding transcriptional regulator YiaG